MRSLLLLWWWRGCWVAGGGGVAHRLGDVVEVAGDVGVELDQQGSEGSLGADQQALLDREAEATVGGGVVEVGDAAGGDVAEEIGVVGLPLAIVALAVDGGADGVEEALA